MKNILHYTKAARRDLDGIFDYISLELQNKAAAERTVSGIMDALAQLKDFPESGTPLSAIADVVSSYRFLVAGNYLAFYRIQGRDIYVERVLYGRRDYLRILLEEQ